MINRADDFPLSAITFPLSGYMSPGHRLERASVVCVCEYVCVHVPASVRVCIRACTNWNAAGQLTKITHNLHSQVNGFFKRCNISDLCEPMDYTLWKSHMILKACIKCLLNIKKPLSGMTATNTVPPSKGKQQRLYCFYSIVSISHYSTDHKEIKQIGCKFKQFSNACVGLSAFNWIIYYTFDIPNI